MKLGLQGSEKKLNGKLKQTNSFSRFSQKMLVTPTKNV